MPSARIHEVIALKLNKDMDELLLRIGTVSPDSWRNQKSNKTSKYISHFWDFSIKEGQANDYQRFYQKYYNDLSNPFYYGYLIHLIVDQYWKTNIDPIFEIERNGIKYFRLKDGTLKEDIDDYGYHESLKIQKQLAKKYNLSLLPIEEKDIPNFKCNIEEIDLSGLFGPTGTLNYINTNISPRELDLDSEVYDIDTIEKYIDETINFVKKELIRLEDPSKKVML